MLLEAVHAATVSKLRLVAMSVCDMYTWSDVPVIPQQKKHSIHALAVHCSIIYLNTVDVDLECLFQP